MKLALLDVFVDYGRNRTEKEISFFAFDNTTEVFYVSNECFRQGKLVVRVLDAFDKQVFVEIPGVPTVGAKRCVVDESLVEYLDD